MSIKQEEPMLGANKPIWWSPTMPHDEITIDERLRNLGYTHSKSRLLAYASTGKHEIRDPQGNVVGHFTAGEACELLARLGG
jgi:hypothetical protein